MATKRITKELYNNSYDILNSRINSTLNNALTSLEKKHLYDFLNVDRGELKEPFIKRVFENDYMFTEAVQDEKFSLPRIFQSNEEEFIRKRLNLQNSLSRVALTRVMTRYPKVSHVRLSFATAKQPLRHVILGR